MLLTIKGDLSLIQSMFESEAAGLQTEAEFASYTIVKPVNQTKKRLVAMKVEKRDKVGNNTEASLIKPKIGDITYIV
jgi:hypothetical protein